MYFGTTLVNEQSIDWYYDGESAMIHKATNEKDPYLATHVGLLREDACGHKLIGWRGGEDFGRPGKR